jgi:MFS transporter, DHA3 family, macrolide efflux protein
MKKYIELLDSYEIVKRLSIIQLISYFGAWFTNVAIFTLLLDMGVSALVIATVAALQFLPGALQAPFSGTFSDKYHPKKLMLTLIVIEIFSTLLLIFINELHHIYYLYILIFIRMGASSFYFTVEMSLLPKLLKGEDLKLTNELHSIIWSFSYTAGMAIGGVVVYYIGVKAAFLLDASMFLIAFILLYTLHVEIDVINKNQKSFELFLETFTYIKNEPKVLALILLHAFVGFSVFDTIITLSVEKFYASVIAVSLAIGLLNAARAFGLVIGPIILSKYVNEKTLAYLFVLQGVSIFLWALVIENFYMTFFVSILVGFSTTIIWSYTYTLLQNNTKKEYYGRVVAYNDLFFLLTGAFTAWICGFLADIGVSLHVIALLLGSAFLFGSVYYVWIKRKFDIIPA